MVAADDIDLVQDITTDCSVVASLCAGTARARKGHGKVSSPLSQLFQPLIARSSSLPPCFSLTTTRRTDLECPSRVNTFCGYISTVASGK
jgi:hypothetical protein